MDVSAEFVKKAAILADAVPALQAQVAASEKRAADLASTVDVALDSLVAAGAVTPENREKVASELGTHEGAIRLVHRMGTNFAKVAAATKGAEKTAAMVNGAGYEAPKALSSREKAAATQAELDARFDSRLTGGINSGNASSVTLR